MSSAVRDAVRLGGGLLLGAALVLVVVVAVPQVVGADHSFVVMSGSMEPAVGTGDVIFVREVPPEDVERGDVITFRERSGSSTMYTTHRVVEVTQRDGELHFRTKGDANDDPDAELVAAGEVVGRMAFRVPYVGYFVAFARSRLGVLLFMVVPGLLLLVTELKGLAEAFRDDSSTESVLDRDSSRPDE